MSKAVCSSPLAHPIVSNDGSRFEFSHGFTDLRVSQAIDVLCDKEDKFLIRTNYSKGLKEKVPWPDSTVDNSLYRHKDLEYICLFEFVTDYQKIYKTFKNMNKKQDK